MKRIIYIMAIGALMVGCKSTGSTDSAANSIETKETVKKDYGMVKVDPSKAISVKEMLSAFEAQDGEMEFTFEAELNEVCSKAGCWINIDKGNGETFMVRFKNHFTIPPETPVGTEAYIHGIAFWDTVSVDLQRHFIEDAGGTEEEMMAITEPLPTIGFTGDGIKLK